MEHKIHRAVITAILCLQLLLVFSGCCSEHENTMYSNKIDHVEPLQVVVLTGGHDFDEKPFYDMFANFENLEIDHIKINKECTYFDDISQWGYDVIVFYNFRNELSADGRQNLLKLCNNGLGMVVLHHAIAGFPQWPIWQEIAGAQYFLDDTEIAGKLWKRCTYKHDVTFTVKVEKSDSVVTDGIEDFEIVDETYKGYWLESDNQILLTADNPHSQKEIGWTRNFKKSRVCYIQSGHGKDAFENLNYQQLLNQAIHWAGSVAVQPGNSKQLQKHQL